MPDERASAAGEPEASGARVQIGGRHGSPTVLIGLPFSGVKVVEADPSTAEHLAALAAAVERLALLTQQLAAGADPAVQAEADVLATTATELRSEIEAHGG